MRGKKRRGEETKPEETRGEKMGGKDTRPEDTEGEMRRRRGALKTALVCLCTK